MVKLTRVKTIEQFKKIHGDLYNYDKVEYINSDTDIIIVCDKHGDFVLKPRQHKQGMGCKLCRYVAYGVGVNDADYKTNPTINGKVVICPYYRKWTNLIMRCYDSKFHIKNPTYKEYSVDPEWHSFMNFRKWMVKQDWKGKELVRNVLVHDNKIYSKDMCMFVDKKVKNLLLDNESNRGLYHIGVMLEPCGHKYRASLSHNSKTKYLGIFNTEEEASVAYKIAKSKIISDTAKLQKDVIVKKALIDRSLKLLDYN